VVAEVGKRIRLTTTYIPCDDRTALLLRGYCATVLGRHVVARKIMAKDVKAGELKTINGGTLAAAVSSGVVTVDGAHVTRVDIEATNGIIHVIDRVLTPKDVQLASAA
jgi:uncharacterized surface protein with fasciclin (FAS1) repeats